VWIRRDLRLTDNQALASALAQADQVLPVFVIDPGLWTAHKATRRQAFLIGGLRRLDSGLRERGGRLIVRHGDPRDALARLVAETGATTITAERDYSPYARRRDDRVAQALPLRLTDSLTVHPPAAIVKADGKPYTVFTPFSRAWKAVMPPMLNSVLPAPERIPTPANVTSDPLPVQSAWPGTVPFVPGEAEAQTRLAVSWIGMRIRMIRRSITMAMTAIGWIWLAHRSFRRIFDSGCFRLGKRRPLHTAR